MVTKFGSYEHNININNKLMQNHVHKGLTECKEFTTLKVVNFMCNLVKWTHNFNINKNCTPTYGISFFDRRLQFFYYFQNNFSSNLEMFNPPLNIV
jgi:hypothetical protein